jgi:hypothetical protein
MLELEIQTLSEKREGLLMDIGRLLVANGFTLQRHRLVQDPHGALMTMVVRGPSRRKRALESALDEHERIISFKIAPFQDGASTPHFAASRVLPRPPGVAASTPSPAIDALPVVAEEIAAEQPKAPAPVAIVSVEPLTPPLVPEPEPEFVFIVPRAPVPAPTPVAVMEPFVELIPEGPDMEAVDTMLPKLKNDYPQIFPRLLKLDAAVSAVAREASLMLVGQRLGAWVSECDPTFREPFALQEAIERVAIPALAALVDVGQRYDQLHIRHSPLCSEDGHSGCAFFNGYLQGLLGPATGSDSLSIFAVCCRSYGADACVLAISE